MKGYFFLGSLLPLLRLGAPIDMSFDDLMALYQMNLSSSDLKKVGLIRGYIDLHNVSQLLRDDSLDPRGNLTEKELDEALVNRDGLPLYLYEHLDMYETLEDQIRFFSRVLSEFFREAREKCVGFLRFYFTFEREWRLVLTGLRAKNLQIDLAKELQHEEVEDPFVAQLLAQKEGTQFQFPFGYSKLDEALKERGGNPMEQYRAMAKFRYDHIAEQIQNTPFSVEYILGYLVQFMLIEDWNGLSDEEGNRRLNTIVKDE